MGEPIIKFKDEEEAKDCLNYWKKKLFLQDWIIGICFVPYSQAASYGMVEISGKNELSYEINNAVIYIVTELPEDVIQKESEELTLIHELLHCRYNLLTCQDSYEGKMLDLLQHQQLEKLAKTLFMVKYDLPFDWFYNVGEKDVK